MSHNHLILLDDLGGRTRARTWDPLIKSTSFCFSLRRLSANYANLVPLAINALQMKCKPQHAPKVDICRQAFDVHFVAMADIPLNARSRFLLKGSVALPS